MGVVKKQAFLNSIILYIGIALGYVNLVILFPRFLEGDEYGLIRLLMAIAVIFSQFAGLGVRKTAVKFLPFFKTEDGGNRGFLTLILLIPVIGTLVFGLLYIVLRGPILGFYTEQSELFIDNYYMLLPLGIGYLFSIVLDSYLQSLLRTVFTNFMMNIFTRLTWLGLVLAYSMDYISFDTFLWGYILVYAGVTGSFGVYLLAIGRFRLRMERFYFRKRIIRLITTYSIFSTLTGLSSVLVARIDMIMVGFLMAEGLVDAGVYGLAVSISVAIATPGMAITKITTPLIARYYKEHNFKEIKKLYQQTAIIQLLIGGILFVGIWTNVDGLLAIVKNEEFQGSQYVILFLGLSRIFDLMTGANGQILGVSSYYRYDTYGSFALAVVAVLTNLAMIPLYGLEGAAIATAFSILLYNLYKMAVVYSKFKMQPFGLPTLYAFVILGLCLLVGTFLPKIGGDITDILVRSVATGLAWVGLVILIPASPDIRNTILKVAKRYLPI